MEARQTLNAALIAWFTVFVQEFRRNYDALPDESKMRLSALSDFRAPCQILVFWATQPDYQEIFVIREPEIPNDVIKVYGPAPSESMISESERMLSDRWFDSALESVRSQLERQYKDLVENQLLGILKGLPQARLRLPSRKEEGMTIIKRGETNSRHFIWTIFDNLLRLHPGAVAAQTVSDAVRPGEVGQPPEPGQVTVILPPTDATPQPTRKGFVSAFYPPIWLGEPHTFSFREKLDGFYLPVSSKQTRLNYKGRELTVMLNGLLTLIEPDREICSDHLNEIMSTALLLGVPATSVRGNDLVDVLFYDNGNWGQYSMDISERRRKSLAQESTPIREEEFEKFKPLFEDDLRALVTKAQEATKDPDQSNFAKWYIDAHTYREDGDYDHSILKSWLIIERHIESLWKRTSRKVVHGKGKHKPTVKQQLTHILKMEGITQQEHDTLDRLRDRRNEVAHDGRTASPEWADEFLTVAEALVRNRLMIINQNP